MTKNTQTEMSIGRRADDRNIDDQPTPSQQGSGGGNMARKVGQRDELKTGQDGDPLPTSVDGRDKPEAGDMPTQKQTRE